VAPTIRSGCRSCSSCATPNCITSSCARSCIKTDTTSSGPGLITGGDSSGSNSTNNNINNNNINNESRNARRHLRVYSVVLQRASIAGTNSSSKKTATAAATTTLTAQVTINAARYPSVIPRWKIASSSSSSSSSGGSSSLADDPSLETLQDPERLPLYNEDLARLEKDVNRNVDRLVVSSDQSTYDWILGQQLVEIARGWGD